MAAERRRLYLDRLPSEGGAVELPAESAKHARVLRLARGDEVELFDGRGGVAEAVVTELGRGTLRCEAAAARQLPRPRPALHLLLGLPKGSKLEGVVRMLGELGLDSVRPVRCERSVPRPGADHGRGERLERIAREACAQSGQPWALEVRPLAALLDAAAEAPAGARRIVFWERSTGSLDAATPAGGGETPVVCVVGPEGGLDAEEVRALAALGYRDVGLGSPRLRVETAAVAAAALLLDRMGRLGARAL